MTQREANKIEYFDYSESFGMSGPWIGCLKLDEKVLKYKYLHDNYLQSDDKKLYVFNLYQPEKYKRKFLFGLIRSDFENRKFRILVFNSETEKWFKSVNYWESLFLTRLGENSIFFTKAFHDGDRVLFPEQKVEFDNSNFIELRDSEVFV